MNIYFLSDYNWERGTLVSEGPKNYKISTESVGGEPYTISISKDKCASSTDKVCVVWETWKGRNGRGGYRVERELYPNYRVSADQVARQSFGPGRVTETSIGKIK